MSEQDQDQDQKKPEQQTQGQGEQEQDKSGEQEQQSHGQHAKPKIPLTDGQWLAILWGVVIIVLLIGLVLKLRYLWVLAIVGFGGCLYTSFLYYRDRKRQEAERQESSEGGARAQDERAKQPDESEWSREAEQRRAAAAKGAQGGDDES